MREKNLKKKYINNITKRNAWKIISRDKNKIFTMQYYRDKIKIWETAKYMMHYPVQEKIIDKLFKDPKINELVKIKILDNFYSTNLKEGISKMYKNIVKKEAKERIARGDIKVVKDISKVGSNIYGKKECTSFSSKYCSRYNKSCFPIYDKYVKQMLCLINQANNFFLKKVSYKELYDYEKYCDVVNAFIEKFYNQTKYKLSYKEFDRYIWTWAKEIIYKNNQL